MVVIVVCEDEKVSLELKSKKGRNDNKISIFSVVLPVIHNGNILIEALLHSEPLW